MTLDDLRVFTTVVESGSINRAARHLGCTQPAVSQHISRLEHEFETPLFERSSRGVTLTAAGRVFYDASNLGLGALSLARQEIERLRSNAAGRLAIVTGGATIRHFLRDAIVRFRELYPEVNLHFEPASSTQRCLEAVSQRRADLAFVTLHDSASGEDLFPGFEQRPVAEVPLVLLVRCDDPLATRQRLSLHDLQMIRYIAMPESSKHYRHIHDELARQGVNLIPAIRVDDYDTANVFVEMGLGQSIVPAIQGRHFERGGQVKTVPADGLPPICGGWIARRFRLLPPVVHDFMSLCTETMDQWRDIPGMRVLA